MILPTTATRDSHHCTCLCYLGRHAQSATHRIFSISCCATQGDCRMSLSPTVLLTNVANLNNPNHYSNYRSKLVHLKLNFLHFYYYYHHSVNTPLPWFPRAMRHKRFYFLVCLAQSTTVIGNFAYVFAANFASVTIA
jgi:hypothetical protein